MGQDLLTHLVPYTLPAGPIGPSPFFPVGSFIISPYKPGVKVYVSMTPAIYWASKDPRIQALRGTLDSAPWMELAKKGLWIDHEIMVMNQDPPTIHALRIQGGWTWTPNAIQPNVSSPPFVHVPWAKDYDPADTKGHIVSSVDKNAYRPFGT